MGNPDAATEHLPYYDPSPSYAPEQAVSTASNDFRPPPTTYSIFPKDIVFYRTDYISLIIGPQYKSTTHKPSPLFYVSVHMDNRFTNRSVIPQIRLHYGPDNTYPVIGTVRFRASTTSDITIWHHPPSSAPLTVSEPASSGIETKIEFTKTGAMTSDLHTFYHILPEANGLWSREKYEWKHSGEPEVTQLATENLPGENISQQNRGVKLIRAATQEMIAVFSGGVHSRLYNPRRVAGKLRFVDEGANEELRLLAVMSILSIVERGRRNATFNASTSVFAGCVIS